MNILTKIRFGVWAMHPMAAEAYLPVIAQLLKGNLTVLKNDGTASNSPNQKIEAAQYAFEDGSQTRWYSDFVDKNQRGVAIYNIEGAITKADQECGPSGTVTLMRQMRMLDNNANIDGHVLNIDSGGGEATNIAEVARFIRSDLKKPVIAHFNGLMCSAAYGIGCAADEVYATLGTDIVGSIGVMMTIADWKAYFEKEGLKLHDIYADQSTDKNQDFYAALDGNYEPLKKNLLNPFAEQFISLVQSMRPGTVAHEDVFTGKVFLAQDAKRKGLIDGTRSFNDSVNRVFEMSKKGNIKQNSSSKNKTNMKIFGIDLGLVAKSENGDVTMTAEQYAKLEAASTTANDNAETITAVTTKVDAMEKNMATLIEAVTGLKAWADATPAAAVAKPQEAPKNEAPNAVQNLNTIFAKMAGVKA